MTQTSKTEARTFPASTKTSLLITSVVAILEVATLWVWSLSLIPTLVAVLLHGLYCGVFLLLRSWYKKIEENNALPELAFLFVLTLGPLGAVGIILTLLLYAHYRKNSTAFEIWYKELVPQQVKTDQERLIEQFILLGKEEKYQPMDPVPFADVLSSGDQSAKRAMLTLMLRNFHPSFAPVFHQALKDSDSAIRVHAASVITRIKENFQVENMKLEKRRLNRPSDLENLTRLAKHYDERATAGLSDDESLEQYRQKARSLYAELHKKSPSDITILWLWGRVLLRSGEFIKAAKVFENALDLLDARAEAADPFQLVWYLECLYERSRYTKLRQQIRKYRNQIPEDSILQLTVIDNIDLWIDKTPEVLAPQ